jgi:hypothetical protein
MRKVIKDTTNKNRRLVARPTQSASRRREYRLLHRPVSRTATSVLAWQIRNRIDIDVAA